jgi:hypothetical protein
VSELSSHTDNSPASAYGAQSEHYSKISQACMLRQGCLGPQAYAPGNLPELDSKISQACMPSKGCLPACAPGIQPALDSKISQACSPSKGRLGPQTCARGIQPELDSKINLPCMPSKGCLGPQVYQSAACHGTVQIGIPDELAHVAQLSTCIQPLQTALVTNSLAGSLPPQQEL